MMHQPISRRALLGASVAGAAGVALPALAQDAEAGLDALARRAGLRFGTAVSADDVTERDQAALLRRECSVLVAENEFKPRHVQRRPGELSLAGADAIARFAKAENMALRGHTICWNQDNRIPQWQLDSEHELAANGGRKMAAAITDYARQMGRRYPEIVSWDAVNEAVLPGQGTIRPALLYRALGDRFIDVAFAAAREAAPRAQLVYNDYMNWSAQPAHRDGVLRMLEAALKRGVRIDALGIQSHLGQNLGRPHDERAWRRFLEAVEGMGLDMLITELDCSDRGVDARDIAARDAEVAAYTKGYLDLTLSFRRVKQVVLWAISDRDSYVNRPGYSDDRRREDGAAMRPHPFDAQLKPKPMRAAIAAALAAAPRR